MKIRTWPKTHQGERKKSMINKLQGLWTRLRLRLRLRMRLRWMALGLGFLFFLSLFLSGFRNVFFVWRGSVIDQWHFLFLLYRRRRCSGGVHALFAGNVDETVCVSSLGSVPIAKPVKGYFWYFFNYWSFSNYAQKYVIHLNLNKTFAFLYI